MAERPTLAELTQYPPSYDGPEGAALAGVLSEVASVVTGSYPAGVAPRVRAHAGFAALVEEADLLMVRIEQASDPSEARQAFIDGAAGLIASVRLIDEAIALRSEAPAHG